MWRRRYNLIISGVIASVIVAGIILILEVTEKKQDARDAARDARRAQDDNAKANYNKRPCRCGRSSLARLFSRAGRGHRPSVFTLLSDGLARLRPLEGATS